LNRELEDYFFAALAAALAALAAGLAASALGAGACEPAKAAPVDRVKATSATVANNLFMMFSEKKETEAKIGTVE